MRECSCPLAAPCCQRRPVDLQEAAVNAAIPLGHGPMRETLIEIARQESNQGWMDPGVGIGLRHGPERVAMPNRSGRRGRRWRGVGAADRLEARVPEVVHGPPFLAHATI